LAASNGSFFAGWTFASRSGGRVSVVASRQKPMAGYRQDWSFLQETICYLVAFNIASFGWKKLFGLQFIVPPAIASQPMSQQSGEWLTWYYFGY
jgi:hypothetical protein